MRRTGHAGMGDPRNILYNPLCAFLLGGIVVLTLYQLPWSRLYPPLGLGVWTTLGMNCLALTFTAYIQPCIIWKRPRGQNDALNFPFCLALAVMAVGNIVYLQHIPIVSSLTQSGYDTGPTNW